LYCKGRAKQSKAKQKQKAKSESVIIIWSECDWKAKPGVMRGA
jgi:hypothetical protein